MELLYLRGKPWGRGSVTQLLRPSPVPWGPVVEGAALGRLWPLGTDSLELTGSGMWSESLGLREEAFWQFR